MRTKNTISLVSFSPEAKNVVRQAQTYADDNNHAKVEPIHLLHFLLRYDYVRDVFAKLKVDIADFSKALKSRLDEMPETNTGITELASSTSGILEYLMKKYEQPSIEELFLYSAKENKGAAAEVFADFSITKDDVVAATEQKEEEDARIDRFTHDITELMKKEKPIIVGREKEVQRLIQILGRETKNHPLLIGEYGVGKSSIVNALAMKIVSGEVHNCLANVSVLKLNLGEIFSGTNLKGDIDTRIKQIVSVLKPNVVLYIDGINAIVSQGITSNSISEYLKPILTDSRVRFFGSCTPAAYRTLQDKDADLLRYFTPLTIDEPSIEYATEIVCGILPRLEKFHAVKITKAAAETSVKLAKRYVQNKFLPDSAISLLDEACSKMRIVSKTETVDENDVAGVLSDWTGIPMTKMLESENAKLQRMEETIKLNVVGQDEAVAACSKAVRRSRVGLRDAGKPIGSFLFLGPSGVGKTQLAKALAEFIFDDEKALIRFDMSEFMERHMAQRLLGSPPGYTGSEAGGQLTEAVKKRPYSVLLFDEVEKAHADVFNLLLQVLDDGRLTDGRGQTTDFSNTVVIMTSNIGSKLILEAQPEIFDTEEGRAGMKEQLLGEMKAFLRPEFINRIDDIVVFRALNKEHMSGIADIQVRNIGKMLASKKIGVSITDEAKMMLVEDTYEPRFGARPLKRALLKAIQDPIAERVIAGECDNGRDFVLQVADGKLVLV